MNTLFDLISIKEKALDSLQKEKNQLQEQMANPKDIQNNAQKIEDTKRTVELLVDASSLAEETSSNEVSSKEVLKDLIDHLEEVKTDVSNKKDVSSIDKDIQLIKNVMDKDFDNSSDIDTDVSLPGFDDF